jgi:hypothetical protein
VRQQWFYRGCIVAVLIAATTLLGCGTMEPGSVSPSSGPTSTDAAPSTSALADSPTPSTSPPTTATAPVPSTTPTTSAADLTQDYAVYSALIQDTFIERLGSTLIVIPESTVEPSTDPAFVLGDCLGAAKREWPALGADILSAFTAKNQTPLRLERRFDLSVDYTLVSEEDAIMGWGPPSTAWDAFAAKYPGSQGSIWISRVGFNKAKDTALLYVGTSQGDLVMLKKAAGRWTVQGQVLLWEA